jgi:hypothetical protein
LLTKKSFQGKLLFGHWKNGVLNEDLKCTAGEAPEKQPLKKATLFRMAFVFRSNRIRF